MSNYDPPQDELEQVMPTVSDITKKNTTCFVSRTRGPIDDIVHSSRLIPFVSKPEHMPSQVQSTTRGRSTCLQFTEAL